MTSLRATFHFEIRRLLVERDTLGTSHEVDHGAYRVRITLPACEDPPEPDERVDWSELDARFPPREAFPEAEGFRTLVARTSVSGDSVPEVTVIRAECFFEGAVGAADFAGGTAPKQTTAFGAAVEAVRGAGRATREALRALLELVRVDGQHWLGPDAGSPRALGRSELVDLDAGRRLPVSLGLDPDHSIRVVERHQVLDAPRLADAIGRVNEGVAPPMEHALRADAVYMLQDAEPPDYPRAVLTAAIACELKVKAMLREHATQEQTELVALLLKRPPMSLQQLFHKPLKILVGKSLCDDDEDLYRRLGDLIERRNGLAHKGDAPPDKREAREHVKTAVEVFRWLEAVEQGGG